VHVPREKAWVYQSTRPCLPCVEQLVTAGQLRSGQPVWYGKVGRYGPSITYKITPAGPLSFSQPGGKRCWASPLAFDLIVCTKLKAKKSEKSLSVEDVSTDKSGKKWRIRDSHKGRYGGSAR
jgi:hypothetical protein